ncbi:MAG: hypothetical protein M3024_04255 [Candidatus Dormibacteraeota bacterium]|nr:hypothetical protein [Candidatus Dormibacteraeota bacterium]
MASTGLASISPWWWLLAAIVLVGLVVGGVLLARSRSRRQAWTGQLAKLATDLRWVERDLMPWLMSAATAAEFVRIWTDGRSRLVAADQQLYGLLDQAPDAASTTSVTGLRAAIAGLIGAVDAEAALTAEAGPDALRLARSVVERARAAFTAALDVVGPVGAPARSGPPAPPART